VIRVSYSKETRFQREVEKFVSLAIAEVTFIHNVRLFRSLLSYLQYFSDYVKMVSFHPSHRPELIHFLVLVSSFLVCSQGIESNNIFGDQ